MPPAALDGSPRAEGTEQTARCSRALCLVPSAGGRGSQGTNPGLTSQGAQVMSPENLRWKFPLKDGQMGSLLKNLIGEDGEDLPNKVF